MFQKLFFLPKISLFLLFLVFAVIFSQKSFASMDYFDSRIQYFGSDKLNSRVEGNIFPKKQSANSKSEKRSAFNWKPYLDPSSNEFFREGDYIPPAPLMELARNPTDENIKNWFAIVDAKNTLMKQLHSHIQSYITRNAQSLTKEETKALVQVGKKVELEHHDYKRYRFLMYFESTCPHCKRMLNTLQELQNKGYYVEVRQIDNKSPPYPVPFALIKASPEEIRSKKINSWPVLFVADTQKKLTFRINGYLPTDKLFQALQYR